MIHTVTGNIPRTELGHAQCHEHIFLKKGASYRQNPALLMEDTEASVRELCDYRAAGGNAIVDAQPCGCGRMAEALLKASQESNIRIIASTGFHKRIFWDDGTLGTASTAALTERFLRELTEGMSEDGSLFPLPCCAGILKMVLDGDPFADDGYSRLYAACTAAAKETGAPILMHLEPKTDVLGVIDRFLAEGIPPEQLIFCHMDRTHQDAGLHREALRRGIFLCYDSVHREKYIDKESHFRLLCESLERFPAQIVLSLDTTSQRLRHYSAKDMGLDYLLTDYLPWLKTRGIPDALLHALTVETPARALDWND